MTSSAFLTLIGVWLAIIVAPGPDVVQIIRLAPRSRAAGLACAAGIVTGILIWVSASLAGLSAVIAARPGLLGALQIAGGGFLVVMGIMALRSVWLARRIKAPAARTEELTDEVADVGEIKEMSAAAGYRLGLATNLSNPKALIFFGAVFAQFIRPDMGLVWTFTIAATLLIVAAAFFTTFALIVRIAARWLVKYSAHLDLASGVIFAILGGVMIVEGSQALLG